MEIVKTASLFSVAELQHAQLRKEPLAIPSQEPSLPLEGASAHSKAQTSATPLTSPMGTTTSHTDAGETILLMNVWNSSEYSSRCLLPSDALPSCENAHTRADDLNAYVNYILEAMH